MKIFQIFFLSSSAINVFVFCFQIMGEFSSSEDELENIENQQPRSQPLRMDFINLYRLGLCDCLALSALPGCRFREVQRSLREDIQTILDRGITDVMVLMQPSEFRKYRVPNLLEEYEKHGLMVHHHILGAVHK